MKMEAPILVPGLNFLVNGFVFQTTAIAGGLTGGGTTAPSATASPMVPLIL